MSLLLGQFIVIPQINRANTSPRLPVLISRSPPAINSSPLSGVVTFMLQTNENLVNSVSVQVPSFVNWARLRKVQESSSWRLRQIFSSASVFWDTEVVVALPLDRV
ncbi:hypothetical protein [Chroococcidiopsis sp. SAG 2025]|uniref:hypothetical protein n=1 Tax=Chroococcidiopsis sp. SAG 2025 TaxID=171389 RepID=UPI0029373A1E|nr:hypothetical protein [Chroococcidiopsis sp. SAG 2025]